jgi:3-hydroxyisobutyrate dehydrogenase-like beta-hydroxyacid dehydrogenase
MNIEQVTKSRLGFIGLGAMGSRMAARLLDAGYPLGVYDRTTDKTRSLVERGARAFDSPSALTQQSDFVLSSLADDAAVEQVYLDSDGVVAGARTGSTLIDLSSVYPDTMRRVAAVASDRGIDVLDAAVSGSTPQAQEGGLVVFVGGDQGAYERSRPILDILGQSVFHLGPIGAGQTMKLVVNAMLGVGIQALAEAITLGERAGLQRDQLIDVLNQTTVLTPGQKAKLENARRDEYPVAFALRLMWKDFGNVLRLAEAYKVPMPATAAALQVFAIEQAKQREEDFSAVIRTMEELAGLGTPESAEQGAQQ